jgi:hypothetical protein
MLPTVFAGRWLRCRPSGLMLLLSLAQLNVTPGLVMRDRIMDLVRHGLEREFLGVKQFKR